MRDNFSLFDKKGDGKINIAELGTVLRALGQNPTEAEVNRIQREISPTGKFNYGFFYSYAYTYTCICIY